MRILRSTNAVGELMVNLSASKSGVALPKVVTLPRLELCTAVLAAQLANLVSRRTLPKELINLQFWCNGSKWLSESASSWGHLVKVCNISNPPDVRSMEISCPAIHKQKDFPLDQYSSINKLVRIVADMHRFKTNCLLSKANRQHHALTIE
ncbi:hypothetical protein Trydic_g5394 [Trypoxylus dichotomus]